MSLGHATVSVAMVGPNAVPLVMYVGGRYYTLAEDQEAIKALTAGHQRRALADLRPLPPPDAAPTEPAEATEGQP